MLLQKFSSIKQPRGFWEDSFPSASVNARQKSSIKFATVDQVPGIIKCTSYHRGTEIAAAVDQVFLPGHFNCHSDAVVVAIAIIVDITFMSCLSPVLETCSINLS
jgi:hypothetical protein